MTAMPVTAPHRSSRPLRPSSLLDLLRPTLLWGAGAAILATSVVSGAAQTPPGVPPTQVFPARDPNARPADLRTNSTIQTGTTQEVDPDDLPPPIQLEPAVADFGFVNPSATPQMTVKLRNTSDKPLTILAIQPSCKCTTINDLVGEEIPPGGFVELEASMKAQSGPGPKKADIKILADGFSRVVTLQLLMEVTLPIRVVPGYINAVSGQPLTGRLVVESLDKQPFSIAGVHGRPPKFVGFDPATDAPKNQYLVEYDVGAFKQGEVPLFMVIETDHPECPLVDVRLRHESTFPKPVLKMQEYRITVGRLEEGESGEVTFEIGELPAEEPVIAVASAFPGVKVELVGEPAKEGIITTYTAKVTPPAGFHGLFYAPVTLYTTRRQQEMFVWGLVVPKGHPGTLGLMEGVPGTCAMRWKGGAAATAEPKAGASAATSAPAVRQ